MICDRRILACLGGVRRTAGGGPILVLLPFLPRALLPFLRAALADEANENGTGTVAFLFSPRCDIAECDRSA